MQGVILSFDPKTKAGIVVADTADRTQYALSPSALDDSLFNVLRQGQRVNFDLDNEDLATNIRTGAENDMGISSARV